MLRKIPKQDLTRLRSPAIRRAMLAIRPCEPTWKKAGVYCVEFEGGSVKIGMSQKMCNRLEEYKRPWNRPITRIRCFKVANPVYLEDQIKNHFKDKRVGNSLEFFTGGPVFDQIIDFIQGLREYSDT